MSQIHGTRDVTEASRDAFNHVGEDPQEVSQLQLSQPEQDADETSGSATE